MSIRRKIVIKNYEAIVSHMYGDDPFSSGAYDGGKDDKVAA